MKSLVPRRPLATFSIVACDLTNGDLGVAVARELQAILQRTGHYSGSVTDVYDEATRAALEVLCGIENLEERWRNDDQIDGVVLRFLREKFGGDNNV